MKVRKAVSSRQRRKSVLAQTKGMQRNRRRSYKLAKQAITRALEYSYRDRRNKKRTNRALWIKRINAQLKQRGYRYSEFQAKLVQKKIGLNRKTLSQLAFNNPEVFDKVIDQVYAEK